MATLKTIKRNHRSESLRGKFMVDTVRGVLRVRKWPKKRGTPTSESQLWWIDWFRQANKLAKYIDAASMRRAIELTAGTGKYPRDIILQAMRGRLYVWTDENGKVWYPMAAVQDISDTLDILAQNIGSVLVRATDRWRAATGEAAGKVLTSQGTGLAPTWETPGGGGGFQGGAMARRTTNLTMAGWSAQAIPFDVEEYDNAGVCDITGQPTRMTVQVGQTWAKCHMNIRFTTVGRYSVYFKKNGALFPGNGYQQFYDLINVTATTCWIPVVATDYFEAFVYNWSSGTKYVQGATTNPTFSMEIT